ERTGAFGAGRAEGTGTNGRWAEGSGSGVLAGLAARISILGWAAPGRAEGRDSASLMASNAGWLALKVRGVGAPFPAPTAGMFPSEERRAGRLPGFWVRPVPPVRAHAASRDGGGAPWGVGRRVSFAGRASRPSAGIEGREPVRRTPEVARTSPEGGRVGVRRGPEPGSPTWGRAPVRPVAGREGSGPEPAALPGVGRVPVGREVEEGRVTTEVFRGGAEGAGAAGVAATAAASAAGRLETSNSVVMSWVRSSSSS